MSRRSLLVRLGFAAALMILLALAIGGVGLTLIFDRQMERRAVAELDLYLKALAAQVRVETDGTLGLEASPTDPRFEQPYGGLYWQIDGPRRQQLRSRSLWDTALPTAVTDPGRPVRARWIDGPEKTQLLSVERTIALDDSDAGSTVHLLVALDRADLQAERRSFLSLLVPSLIALGLLLIVAMAGFIHLALRPFRDLRARLQAVRSGHSRELPRDVPDEVQPVVDELNRMIAFHDASLERARTQAGDLAHGLKTPLAVMGAAARRARSGGQEALADDIDEQVNAMRRQVDRTLARARAGMAAALGNRSAPVDEAVRKTLRAIQTLPGAQSLDWDEDVAQGLHFAGDEGDLMELLGNLLDNARKWARTQVRLTARAAQAGGWTLVIEDDGPGLPEEETLRIERGRRWDESRPGTGFGLAIARDLVEAYRGTMGFSRSPELGGLRICITLPGARRDA
ncbi:hypothetical protein CDO44_06480 [Pigmentiphaga sp. NML080357]|uniref:sensor histidine kinase n=1 Tax=Pigmentiphaga sp. NML080357 TaxID=2008675 RepID=UPI000B40816A|nr:HAMP domain-containing sensor histidine kinase [Pigmentiphaga sp. NML080357]OVZ61278.1 hypothetical protein CDO44_06480 [Pigmentiphaga sp. NML080357]